MCAELVPPPPMDDANHQSSVEVPSEQTFLAQLQAHQPPDDSNITASSHGAWKTAQTTPARNAIGPSMHASTLDVPSIGRVLEEQTREVSLPSSPAPSSRSDDVRTPSITTPKQTEVLHSFFQSRTCLSHYDIYICICACVMLTSPVLKKPSSPASTPGTPSARMHRVRRRKDDGSL